jgi:hypothetical protein
MSKFILEIDCDNAAFGESEADVASELGRILYQLALRFTDGSDGPEIRHNGRPMDANGNSVGSWTYSA